MSDEKIHKLLAKLADKLKSVQIPDDFTGSITLKVQQGSLSPKVEAKTEF